MPRGARLDSPGTLHHVIVRGIERKEIVNDHEDRKNFLTRMGDIALETGTAIYAWVLMIEKMCRENQTSIEALRSGSRISGVSRLRSELAETLVAGFGLSLAETARQLGVTTSAIANGLRRKKA